MGLNFILKIIGRVILLVVLIGLSFYLYYQNHIFSAIFSTLVVLSCLYEFISFFEKILSDIHHIIMSIKHEDYTLKIPDNHLDLSIYKDLKGLYEKNKTEFFEKKSLKIIYENIINGLDLGVMILRKKEDEMPWEIYLMNDYFSDKLQIPKYSNWDHLKERLENFTTFFEKNQFQEFNKSIELSVDFNENQTFSLKTSKIKTYEYTYYIISLDSVQSIIEKKEKQAWYNLLKIISHELMNTLTPVNSLIDNLLYISNQDEWDTTDKDDFNESLKTIKKKTFHIMEFVDNYRELTNLPTPVKNKVTIKSLLEESVQIMKPLLSENKINVVLEAIDENLSVDIDAKLMERVLVNLITNSMHALQKSNNKKIKLSVERKNSRTFISITDNGCGIETEIKDKIFIPFFTTRKTGGGIGLTLAKNIVELHGGYLTFKSNTKETSFVICLF